MLQDEVLYWVMTAIFTVFAAIVLYRFSQMNLAALVCELDGQKASLSRFQFLLFTFVVAGTYLTLCLKTGTFVEIPKGALALIGISGGSYLVSKGISGKAPPSSQQQDGGDHPGGNQPPTTNS